MNEKEKPLFLSKNKKIQLIKNISVNLKCIKAQRIKLDNKINQNISKKNKKKEELYKNKLNNKKIHKNINIIDIKKIPAANRMNQKRCKSTKSLSVNNSNKSYIKHAFIIKRNEKSLNNNKSYGKTTVNTKHKKNDYFKKINLKKANNNNVILSKNNNINNLSPINRPKKIIQNNAEINQNNPMELTFGSSSFMSNNVQTETNETDKDKVSIKSNNKIKKKNNSFFVLNSKKNFKDNNLINTNNNNNNIIGPNKIVKLNKKLILKQSWKIKPSHIKYRPMRALNSKDQEKYKEDKNNKSAFIIHNYNTKTKFNNNDIIITNNCNSNANTSTNKNNVSSIKNKKCTIKENKNIIRNTKKIIQEKKLKSKFITFYKKSLLRNKIFKMKKENNKKSYDNKKILFNNYSLNDSSFYENNKFKNNITQINNNKFNETCECIIKINKSVDKSNGKFKLIIKRANKVIRRMPKSTPKLLLTHPSFKNLFF